MTFLNRIIQAVSREQGDGSTQRLAKIIRKRADQVNELTGRVKELAATKDRLTAIIASNEQESATLTNRIAQLEQDVALRDDVITQLRLWQEEVNANIERRIAMHERAKVLALNSAKINGDPEDEL